MHVDGVGIVIASQAQSKGHVVLLRGLGVFQESVPGPVVSERRLAGMGWVHRLKIKSSLLEPADPSAWRLGLGAAAGWHRHPMVLLLSQIGAGWIDRSISGDQTIHYIVDRLQCISIVVD